MQFNLNEKNQAQCPECGQWVNMIFNENINMHEIEHCRRKWCIFINKNKLEELFKEEKTKKKRKEKSK